MPKEKNTRKPNGSGTFKKRSGGTWEFQVSYGRGSGDKVIRKSFYGKTQAECREKEKLYSQKNTVPIEKAYTVKEWSQRWLELYKKDKCSANMYEQYEHIVNKYIISNIGHLKLSAVRPAHIIEMMSKCTEKSNSFVKKIMLSLRGIFETAIDNDLCIKNPAKNVKAEGKKSEPRKFFSDREISIIEKFCRENRSDAADELMTLLYTGLRREELLGLKWTDVDFKARTISISRAVITENGKKLLKESLKNEHSRRTLPILPQIYEMLMTRERKSEFVFPMENGDYQRPDYLNSRFSKLMKRINSSNDEENQIRELSPHCCRHTFASHLSKSGVDIKIIQTLLGHADISMTGNIYTHSTIEGTKKAVEGFKY